MLKKFEIDGKTLELNINEHNPRYNLDCIGNMICFHSKYNLGDNHKFNMPSDFYDWYLKHEDEMVCFLPLYLYDHSGLAMSTTPYSDPWDSGRVGYYYVSKEDAIEGGYDVKDIKSIQEKMIDEVSEYNSYLEGSYIKIEFSLYDFHILDEGTIYGKKEDMKTLLNNITMTYPEFSKSIDEYFEEAELF